MTCSHRTQYTILTCQAFAPSSPMPFWTTFMFAMEVLTFKASANAWQKRRSDQGWCLSRFEPPLMGQSLIYLKGSRIGLYLFLFVIFRFLVVSSFLATRICNIFEFDSCHLDSICSIWVFEQFISGWLACTILKFKVSVGLVWSLLRFV